METGEEKGVDSGRRDGMRERKLVGGAITIERERVGERRNGDDVMVMMKRRRGRGGGRRVAGQLHGIGIPGWTRRRRQRGD